MWNFSTIFLSNYLAPYPRIVSLVLGGLSTLTLAPFYQIYIWPLTLGVLFTYCDRENTGKKISVKKSFIYGYLFGISYFLIGCYWITYSLLTAGDMFLWLVPIAVPALSCYFALYFGLSCGIYRLICNNINIVHPLRIVIFAVIFTFFEYLRGIIFTGFPWNYFAYSLVKYLEIIQIVHTTNIYFLNIMLITCSIALGVGIYSKGKNRKYIYIVAAIIATIYNYGNSRLMQNPIEYSDKTALIIQAGIEPVIPENASGEDINKRIIEQIKTYMQMSLTKENPDFIIWPEGIIEYPLSHQQNQNLTANLASILRGDTVLISGGLDVVRNKLYNAMYIINSNAEVKSIYHKEHLVPFGEYIPLKKYLKIPAVVSIENYSSGESEKIMSVNDISILPVICYEAAFPKLVKERYKDDLDIIINVSNDGWFGNSTGPYQHLAMVQMRAIENRLPIIRVANTGISAFIDSYGRVIKKIDLKEKNILYSKIPK